MLRSLNFWLFLVMMICGVSFWVASGTPLPAGMKFEDSTAGSNDNWTEETRQQSVHLRILNGTQTSGLARDFSLLVASRGCVVEGVGNAAGSWPKSLLINRRLAPEDAQVLARKFGMVEVIRQWDGRLTEDAVLILGEDFEKLRSALAP